MAKKRDKKNLVAIDNGLSPFADRYVNIWLTAILLFSLLLRIIALLNLKETVYGDFLLWDERAYHLWAEKIATGAYNPRTVYPGAPVPAYFMAIIYWLFSPDAFYIRILNVLLGVLTCWLVYLIAVNLANRKIGLLACLLACLYKPFIFYSVVPLKEALTVCLFAGTAYLLISLVAEKGMPPQANTRQLTRWGLLGVAVGLLLNTRPNAIVFLPLMPLILLWYARRDRSPLKDSAIGLAIYLLGISCTMLPFMIRNYRVAGTFAVTTSQSGLNLYLGNNLNNPDPYYRPVSFATSSPREQGIQFTIEASRRAGHKLTPSEASDYWSEEVIRMAVSQPGAFLRKLGQKTLVLFNRFEACDHYDIDFVGNFARFFKLPFPSFWFVFPLGMAGISRRLTQSRKARALAAVLGLYGLTLIAVFSNARYRLPMLAIMIPFAALALNDFICFITGKRFRQIISCGAVVLAAAIIAALPIQATDDRTAYYNTHAIILDAQGFEKEAILYWQRSSDMQRPFSAFANFSLAVKYFKRGERALANAYLQRIPDDSFAAANKYELMGDEWQRQKNPALAALAYEKSLEINSGRLALRAKLIGIYEQTDAARASQEKEKHKYIEAFYREARGK